MRAHEALIQAVLPDPSAPPATGGPILFPSLTGLHCVQVGREVVYAQMHLVLRAAHRTAHHDCRGKVEAGTVRGQGCTSKWRCPWMDGRYARCLLRPAWQHMHGRAVVKLHSTSLPCLVAGSVAAYLPTAWHWRQGRS